MNPELQRIGEQLQSEISEMWECTLTDNYVRLAKHAETALILAKHAKEIVEREKR